LYDDEEQEKEDEDAPVTLGQIRRVMDDDVTFSTGRAYSWFSDGLRL
jgi:hypothetical protein